MPYGNYKRAIGVVSSIFSSFQYYNSMVKEVADENASIPASTPADGSTYRDSKVTTTRFNTKDLSHKLSETCGYWFHRIQFSII